MYFDGEKSEVVGIDLVFHNKLSMDRIIWWAEDVKKRLAEQPELHDAYFEVSTDEDGETMVYVVAFRPYNEKEQDQAQAWKKRQEEDDRKTYERLKEKYGW
jgi:hypothetical protein